MEQNKLPLAARVPELQQCARRRFSQSGNTAPAPHGPTHPVSPQPGNQGRGLEKV